MAAGLNLEHVFKRIEIEAFEELFPDEERALAFLAEEKWSGGFICRFCGNDNYCKGKSLHSRRCTRCKKEESATAHTIFHRCKIPVNEALRIAYMVCHTPEISTWEISRKMDLRQMTCWKFKKKIMDCLAEKGKLTLVS